MLIAPQIWSDDINQLNDEYFGEDYSNRISSFWVKLFEFLNNRRNISRLKKLLPHKGRILEVGVGSGSLLRLAKNKGYEVMGCDLSEAICHAVSRDTNIEMYCKESGSSTDNTTNSMQVSSSSEQQPSLIQQQVICSISSFLLTKTFKLS